MDDNSNYIEKLKVLRDTEKELGIEKWVLISYEIKGDTKRNVIFQYDMPQNMLRKWLWLIHWRYCKLVCEHPRQGIYQSFTYYDKNTGLDCGYNSIYSKLISAKAQITIAENKIRQYEELKSNELFALDDDEIYQKALSKLELKKKKYQEITMQIKELLNTK